MKRKLLLGIFCGLVEQNKPDIPGPEEQKVFEIRILKENIFVNPPVCAVSDLSLPGRKNKKYFVPKSLGRINTKSKKKLNYRRFCKICGDAC